MLDESIISTASAFWASNLGCTPQELFAEPLRILPHAEGWADYHGVFALLRGGMAVASVPPGSADTLRSLLSGLFQGCSPDRFAAALAPVAAKVIGPTYIGYATTISLPAHPVRALGTEDAAAIRTLRQACDPTEWEHGSSLSGQSASGVFVEGELVAFAGYAVWGDSIAHVSIITHPAFRGRGYGRTAVAHLAGRALRAGLLPQYQTLASNRASVQLAESVGYQAYATSMSVRLGHDIGSSATA